MKKIFKLIIGVQLLSAILIIPSQKAQAQVGVEVSYQSFYDNLSPYGQWVNDPQYGNVFVPNVGSDFRPYYSDGYWAMTDYGNTWVSNEPWGWACYHYGRWTYDSYYGWVWIPGYDWAPAWVDWRYGDGVCGWAPLGPGISIGVGIYNCPADWWVFVGPQYLYRPDFFHYWRGPQYNGGFIRGTSLINNIYRDNSTHVRYNYGPRAAQIQAFTHRAVPVYHISGADRPGVAGLRGNSLSLYRPAVNRATIHTARPANVISAPHAIGRPVGVSANRQPAFRSAAQQGQVRSGQGGGHARTASNHPTNAGAAHNRGTHQRNSHSSQNAGRQSAPHVNRQPQMQQRMGSGQHMGSQRMGGGGQHMGGQRMGGGGQHMGGERGGGGGQRGGGHPQGGGRR